MRIRVGDISKMSLLDGDYTLSEAFVAHLASLLQSIPAHRVQYLEIEFRLKGLRYVEKVAFRKGMADVIRELDDGRWKEVTVYWLWNRS